MKTPKDKVTPKPESAADAPSVVLTIGHSTHPLDEFIQILQAHGVTLVADVRTVPRSWRNPQFNKDSLPESLKKVGVGYIHLAGLGGLRRTHADSVNTGWRNASFRGYADYMQTPEFAASLDELIQIARKDRIAVMCAEAVPWRCHRSLIADALTVRGIPVEDIMSLTHRTPHTLTAFAKAQGERLTYPGEDTQSIRAKPKRKPRTAHG